MMKSSHNSTKLHSTASYARRVLVLVSILMFGLGNIWGQEVKLTFNRNNSTNINATVVNVNGTSNGNSISGASGFTAWKSGGQITNSILCPDVNANAMNAPIILNFTISGLPKDFEFNNVGLFIHALNGNGGYQSVTDEGGSRDWKIEIKMDDDTQSFPSTKIDITEGSVATNREFKAAKAYKTKDGSLNLSLIIEAGVGNPGCFFGLESITLSNPKYKEVEYTKDGDKYEFTPTLLQYWQEIAEDYGITKDELTAKLYARWYLADKNGNEIMSADCSFNRKTYNFSFTQYNGTNNTNRRSWTFYKIKGFSSMDDDFESITYLQTFTIDADVDPDDVRLVCATSINTSSYSGFYGTDPTIQMRYIYTLKEAPEVIQEPKLDEYKLPLYYNSNIDRFAPVPLQSWEDFLKSCGIEGDGTDEYIYVRWYFEDKNGKEVKTAYGIKEGQSFTQVSPQRGYFTCCKIDDSFDFQSLFPTFIVPQNYDSEDLNLVCVATSRISEDYKNFTDKNAVNSWIGDPSVIQVKYVYPILKEVPTKYKTVLYDDENKCTPTLLQYWKEIALDCGIDDKTNLGNLNVRWYFEDEDGNELKDADFNLESTNAYNKSEDINGYYKFGGFDFDDDYESTSWNPTITIPAGYENKRLVCAVISRPDGANDDGKWAEDPANIKIKYVYTLKAKADTHTTVIPTTLLFDNEAKKITSTLFDDMSVLAKDMGVSTAFLKDNLYVRWYFEDIDGNAITKGYTIDEGGIYGETSPNKEKGYYKYGGFGDSENAKYNPTITTIPDGYTYENVRLVCVATTNTEGYPACWIGDPVEMQVKYVYTLKPYADIPTKYKVIIYDDNSRQCSPHLLQFWREVAIDCNVSQEQLKNLYVRWYFVDENGNPLTEDFQIDDVSLKNRGYQKTINRGDGYYKNGGFGFMGHGKELNTVNIPTFTMPEAWDTDKIRLVCLVTTHAGEIPEDGIADMDKMQMRYVYTLKSKSFMENEWEFVHYQGEAYRYLKEKGDEAGAAKRDYMEYGTPKENYVWDIDINDHVKQDNSTNIRQNVHTWEYYIYINDDETGGRTLMLPFQNYTGNGEDKEPRGYIRWYNWDTDRTEWDEDKGNGVPSDFYEANDAFSVSVVPSGSKRLKKSKYGWIATCLEESPTSRNVGLQVQKRYLRGEKFRTPLTIACDVSKYADGMDESYTYLVHEPTLSNRYIFHIRPASELGDRLAKSKDDLEDAREKIDELGVDNFFNAMTGLEEDKGKVVVSLEKGNTGTFSLRFDQQDYDYYFLKNGNNYSRSQAFRWHIYFKGEDGELYWKEIGKGEELRDRITNFTYEDFTTGYPNDIQVTNIDKFHVVGYVCGDANVEIFGNGLYAPVVHYEVDFIEAPHILVEELLAGNVDEEYIERTDEYMKAHYDLAALLDCDGNPDTDRNDRVEGNEATYFSTENWDDEPISSADNMSYVPFQWDDIQYSFSYPTLTHTLISPTSYYLGASPAHGDYTILKSMNMRGVSESWTGEANTYGQNTLPYEYKWWDPTELHDYTYNATGGNQDGSFLYTDASDESRSIATIPFNANLCSGSYIYFTAAVANMTQGDDAADPQLLIRIVGLEKDENTGEVTRKRLVAFLTGVMDGDRGKWYQFYGKATLPSDFNSDITDFEAEIINYANKAYGADFAIDQLAIYTKTSKVLLYHEIAAGCDDDAANKGRVKIYMDSDNLQNAFGKDDEPVAIKWRICRADNDEVVVGDGMYPIPDDYEYADKDLDENGKRTYGVSMVIPDFENVDDIGESVEGNYGWYKEGETYYFQIANQVFPALENGVSYYVSVWDPIAETWGKKKDLCSIYSEFFFPPQQYVTYYNVDGEGKDLVVNCGTEATISDIQMVLKVSDYNTVSGFRIFDKIPFDYAFYPVENWNSNEKLGDDTEFTYADLRDAWSFYRGAESEYNGNRYKASGLAEDFNLKTENDLDCRAVLKYAIDKGLLVLANSPTFTHDFAKVGQYDVICLPTYQTVEISKDVTLTLCVPFNVTFSLVDNEGPKLDLGFMGVDYPENYTRVVRVGLEQLNNLQKDENGFLLHIPVHSYMTDKTKDDTQNSGALEIVSQYLTLTPNGNNLVQTDDPKVTKDVNVATFEGNKIDKDNMYISVNFHGDKVTKQQFYEGFTYSMYFQVKKVDEEGGENEDVDVDICETNVYFLLKIVPGYVTWNDGSEEEPDTKVTKSNKNVSNNWNNDANWSRSRKAELYKTVTNSDGYKDNGTEAGENSVVATPATFVPMKFTYVTIPSKNVAPSLINLAKGTNGIYTNIGDGATPNIQYDMMVRYTEEECLGHEKVADNVNDNMATPIEGSIYDCEKFYGNWAKEIYFKPEAELLNQHYLTYEKVWVEKDLNVGEWTLMSTPLQDTYAGDMYVPSANGRQETEAFQSISFADKDATGKNVYSRTLYPIYQRSWDKEDAKVYTKTSDVRGTDYSATMDFSGDGVSETFMEWSHTYNDVEVPYSTWKGFAIRAHKKDQKKVGENSIAMIRLPKADKSYDYYMLAEDEEDKGIKSGTLDKPNIGKLFTDDFVDDGVTYGIPYGNKSPNPTGEVDESINEIQFGSGYYLVGNPYLCSIDMKTFLEVNKDVLEQGYWTYESNKNKANLSGQIRPLQSFFVKLKDDVTIDVATKITFTPEMMHDGNTEPIETTTAAVKMIVTDGNVQSMASVSVGEEAKSVEALFDSNFEDMPVVHTVANGRAVSINQVTELSKPIAFGVTYAASDEQVGVQFLDIEQLIDGELYVLDAVTGEHTVVNEGSTVSIQPNDYGRYFLLTKEALDIHKKVDVQKTILISVRGKEVKITSGKEIKTVSAVAVNGTAVYQNTDGGNTAITFTLDPGVYVVNVENVAGERQTAKVIIK